MVPKPLSTISSQKAALKQSDKVFLDLAIDGKPIGRLVIELFAKQVPRTAENFRCLCTGERKNAAGKRLSYRGTSFFSVMPGFVAVGGDIQNDNGTGGESIYGKYFPDENTIIPHDGRGILSMMSFENDTNNSQFFITFDEATHLDQYHVAFGKVTAGFSVLDKVEACANGPFAHPENRVRIVDCGEL